MCRKKISKLISLKKSVMLMLALAIISLAGEVNVLVGQTLPGVQIKGNVKEDGTQAPLPGVSVSLKGKTIGTITDIDGNFVITANTTDILVFSYIGFTTQEVPVGNNTTFDINLKQDIMGLDEVVVTGYGVQKKSDLTGAVASVSSEKLNSVPVPNVENALQGMAAGVNIFSKSGRPGEAPVIQIRGISSLNGSNPLVIIDGVAGDLNSINPADIESIEVLKDASSAAIYGSTGGNGVILVTTKTGTSGKMKVDANVYSGIDNPVGKLDMMNAQQYTELLEEINRKHMNTQPDTLKTYDWQSTVFKPSRTNTYDISLSGGNDVSTFMFSTSLYQQNGIVENTDYQRYTMRLNSEHKVNKRLTFDEKVTFVNNETDGFDNWYWHNFYNNPIVTVISADPTIPAYDANGVWSISPNNVANPMPALDNKNKVNKNNNIQGNFGAKVNIIKGLDFQSRITGGIGLNDQKEYQKVYWASPTDFNDQDKLLQSMSKNMSWNFQNYLSYNTTIAENHHLSAMVGMEANKWWWYDISGQRVNMSSDNPNLLYLSKSLNDTADVQNVTGSAGIGAGQGYFGRLNYNYFGRYLLTINVRRDGASNFGPNYRWGTFPSFSVGWKFSEEAFMANVPYLTTGKLRFGYGQTGANGKGGFPYLSTVVTNPEFRYTVNGTTTQTGTGPNQIANPDLHWESVNMSNLGLDLTFFENRVSLTVDAFNKVNDGMILSQETSAIAGTYNGTMPEVNIGKISNKGIEITAGGRKSTGELTGSFDVNMTFLKNEVITLATDSMQYGSVHNITPTNMTLQGYPIAQFYGYYIEGMFSESDAQVIDGKTVVTNQPYTLDANGDKVYAQPKALPGDAKFKDVNGDGKVNDQDKVLLGSPIPKLNFGFSVNLQYKGFDFSAFFNGTLGNKIMNGTKQYLYNPVGAGNRGTAFANRYRDEVVKDGQVVVTENHNTDLYRLTAATYTRMSNFFVEDGSYLRLRNVTLGYTVPKSITEKLGVEKLRIYGGGKNLFTLTKYTGLNPEVGGLDGDNTFQTLTMGVDIGVYPVTRMIYFGANITF